ncbi:hypothetical protein [Synechococcus sp. W70.1]|uniref:hypothetical protein n=1 Tax=Synechococcus sp. W70.1 TaxID=2964534 RepID=UPI0039C00906
MVGSSWLLGSCQLRLPDDVLPETALVPPSAPLALAFSTKPEEVKELQAWAGDRLVQEAGAQVMEADYNRIRP